jgi:hypothetical protein
MNYSTETNINYNLTVISKVTETKFLGLIIEDTLPWKQHIDIVVNKMSSVCYALRNIKYLVSFETLRQIYYAHVHSIMSYGIIFWGGSSNAKKMFILQKKILRIITNTKPRDSCQEIIKK